MIHENSQDAHRGSGIHADAQYPNSGSSLMLAHGWQTVSVTDHVAKPMTTIAKMRIAVLTFTIILC